VNKEVANPVSAQAAAPTSHIHRFECRADELFGAAHEMQWPAALHASRRF